MKVQFKLAVLLACAAFSAACTKEGPDPGKQEQGGFEELVPERPDYVNAELLYGGYDGESADVWTLLLHTDMEVDGTSDPIEGEGPGQVLKLVVNAESNSGSVPDLALLAGEYSAPANSGDFSVGTWQTGDIFEKDTPQGAVEVPYGSYYAEFADGQTDFEADLLQEGGFSVEVADDGTVTIEGVLVGNSFLKRYFSYSGKPEIIDLSQGSGETPGSDNSNLTESVDLSGFTQARLFDRKDVYTWDERARAFVLYLAEDGVDISGEWPSGSGRVLRVEFFVSWETDVHDGIPEGLYEAVSMSADGGIPGEEIKAFGLVPGYPDKFEYFTGSWYLEIEDDAWKTYARIAGGVMFSNRDGDAHILDFKLDDCSDPPYYLNGTWATDGPIEVSELY